ncbi:MAG: glycosyltransferase family 39 protein, partial [Chloroflexota bacterium]|nr:glycosyltransferase family 39 protein [Chloroflexota bacterium]
LGYQAALGDDAFSLVIAGKGLGDLLRLSASEPHPPVFYLLLWAWVRLAGDGEFAARFVAVCWGLVAAALTYRLGARLLGGLAGVLAALLLATSPLFVAYSQQARMYTMVVALGLASMWFVQRMLTDGSGGTRLVRAGYLVTTLLAVTTHFFAFFIVAAQNLLVVPGMVSRRQWSALRVWIALQGLWLAAYLPWVAVALPTLSSYGNELVSQPGLEQALLRTLRAFVVGESAPAGLDWLLVFAAALLALGVYVCWRRRQWLPVAYCFLPPVLVFLASLYRPMYYERYMLVSLPGFALVTAAGGAWLFGRRRWLLAMALAVPVAAAVAVLPAYYAETRYASAADMRGMVGYLNALARQDAVVVINLPPSDPTYQYYYRGSWPLVYLPESGDAVGVTGRMAGLAAEHSEVWYLPYGAERALIEPWLDSHGVKVSDQWYANARLVRYDFPPLPAAAPVASLDARFEQGIRLAGYTLVAPVVQPGQPVIVTLFWQVEAALAKRYKVFAQLLDGQDRLWGQQDSEPGNGTRPTTSWRPGAQISDTYGIVVLPGVAPQDLRLVVGLYDPATGVRLKLAVAGVGTADSVPLGTLRVAPAPEPLDLAAYRVQQPLDLEADGATGLRLVGLNVERLGGSGPATTFQGGQVMHVTLFWRARSEGGQVPTARLALTGPDGAPLAVQEGPLAPGDFPPSRWPAGEVIRDQRHLFLPGEVKPGAGALT